jgi:glycosyltransferase involved in cell wall biosynthesis
VIGYVVIGRNEGVRLQRCLKSIPENSPCVYVDSGSTDDSVSIALSERVHIEHIDPKDGFTAAKARNIGWKSLLVLYPTLTHVHFVDGDCEIATGWIRHALEFMGGMPTAVVACGRRRERYPNASIYNLLCDFEWETPVGRANACGGDMLIKVAALVEVNGYRDTLIAGEEPEMCLRLRASGGEIWRLDHDMTLHDAAITTFHQWFRRSTRAGYAFAEGNFLHHQTPFQLWKKECRSLIFWAAGIPFATLVAVILIGSAGLVFLGAYLVQWVRIAINLSGAERTRYIRAYYLLLGKFPELIGYCKFHFLRKLGAKSRLIEYK